MINVLSLTTQPVNHYLNVKLSVLAFVIYVMIKFRHGTASESLSDYETLCSNFRYIMIKFRHGTASESLSGCEFHQI